MAQMGSFGNVSPDAMAAIKNALTRRQQGESVPALNQQSGASPTASPLPAEPQGGMGTIPSGAAPAGAEAMSGMTGAIANPEAEIILKAMSQRLKAISDIEKGPQI